VLLIDSDPQANATSGLGVENDKKSCTLYDCLIGKSGIEESIVGTEMEHLSLVPSTINLVAAEIELIQMEGREKKLKDLLKVVDNSYDYILIDCSPSLGLLTVNALTASDSVIIPVQCEYFALEGLGKLLNTMKKIQEGLNPDLMIEGFLLTMYDARLNIANQVVEEVNRHFQQMVFSTIIQRNVKLSEAPSFGKPVLLYDAESRGAINYMNLAKEILDKEAKEQNK
ncbi:MAG: ParA family protein, partial [Bacteroidales bacterium]|nr:ParA family protein [Bacteroidales bacterium]